MLEPCRARFEKAVLAQIAHESHSTEVEELRALFKELDKDGNGVLDTDELSPILDLLYTFVLEESEADKHKLEYPDRITVQTDHWIEFAMIFDSNNDGVLQMDEFETYCRFQVSQ